MKHRKILTKAISMLCILGMMTAWVPNIPAAAETTQGSIMIDTKTYTMAPGNVYTYKITLNGAAADDVTTVSSRPNIATVKEVSRAVVNGKTEMKFNITGIRASSDPVTISSSVMGTHASVKVMVLSGVKAYGTAGRVISYFPIIDPTQPVSFSLDTASYTFDAAGKTYQFLAKVSPKTMEPTVSSSDSSVAGISLLSAADSRGYLYEIKALKAGTATISVSLGGITKTLPVTVNGTSPTPTNVPFSLDTASYTFDTVGKAYQFLAKVSPKTDTPTVSSSDSSVVGISLKSAADARGYLYEIKALKAGASIISVTLGGVTKSFPVTVQGASPTTNFTLDTASYTFSGTGRTYQFLAKLSSKTSAPAAATSDSSVVSITLANAGDARGYLYEMKSLKPGTATVWVAIDGTIKSLPVTVSNSDTPPEPTVSFRLDTASYTFDSVGKAYQFLALVSPKTDTLPTASSSDSSVAGVSLVNANDTRGYLFEISALKAGTSTISVTLGSVTKTLPVTVKDSGTPATSFTLDTSNYTFDVTGKTYQFLAKVSPKPSSTPTAVSSNPAIATVRLANANDTRGYLFEIASMGIGSATISVTVDSVTKTLPVSVTAAGTIYVKTTDSVNLRSGPGTSYSVIRTLASGTIATVLDASNAQWTKVQTSDGTVGYVSSDYIQVVSDSTSSLSLSNTDGTVPVGKTFYITATTTPSNAVVTWQSSNAAVATVSNGFIYAVAPGTAVITASSGTKSQTCNVTVTEAEPVKAAYASPNIAAVNSAVQLIAITDSTRDSVRFVVEMNNGSTKTFTATSYTSEVSNNTGLATNNTRVWIASTTFPETGTYSVTAYSSKNGVMSSTGVVTSAYVGSTSDFTTSTVEARRASDQILNNIGRWEGYSSAVYADTLAYNIPTLGYGHVIYPGNTFYNNLTQREAFAQLLNTVNNGSYTSEVNKFIINNNVKTNQNQFDAMVSFSYNVGSGHWNNDDEFDLKTMMLNAVVPPTITGSGLPATSSFNTSVYSQASRSSSVVAQICLGAPLTVTQINYNPANKTNWYKVKLTDGHEGWMNGAFVKFDASVNAVCDLNYVDSVEFGTELLLWNRAGGKAVLGLLYRRLGEAKIFSFGNYAEATPGNANYHHNTYGYRYPSSLAQYEE